MVSVPVVTVEPHVNDEVHRPGAMKLEAMGQDVIDFLLQINSRTFSLTDEQIQQIEDPQMQEILAGLLYLYEDLRYHDEERDRAEKQRNKLYQQLLEMSRQVGRAEVAANLLHNVGNVLNSVNVSTAAIGRYANSAVVGRIGQVATMLDEAEDVGHLVTKDELGKELPRLLKLLAADLRNDMEAVRKECETLVRKVNHIKQVISMNESMASSVGLYEPSDLTEVVEEAIALVSPVFDKHGITLRRDFTSVPPVLLDRHRILQIVVNLLTNARDAVLERPPERRVVSVLTRHEGSKVEIIVRDTGEGIPPQFAERIFEHGFTTKATGHGFGLHASALAADEMGGALECTSSSPDEGTTFVLRIPFKPLDRT